MTYYWGPEDASVHFCENKYEHYYFIGEYYNALTTFLYIFIGLLFINSSISYLGWITVILGITSMILHTTLRYYGQWMDEMSMLLLCFASLRTIRKGISKFLIYPLLVFYYYINHFFVYFFILFTIFQFYLGYECLRCIRGRKKIFIIMYISLFSLASMCWLCDQFLCDYVREFQMHAWWHILTALAIGVGLMAIK